MKSRAAYHLERVELFLDLLRKHRRETVAGRNLAPSVVLLAWPCVVEDDARRERRVSLPALWRSRGALCVLSETKGRHEVVFVADGDGASPPMALRLVIWRAGGA